MVPKLRSEILSKFYRCWIALTFVKPGRVGAPCCLQSQKNVAAANISSPWSVDWEIHCKQFFLWQVLASRKWHLSLKFHLIRKLLLTQGSGLLRLFEGKNPKIVSIQKNQTNSNRCSTLSSSNTPMSTLHVYLVCVWVTMSVRKGSSDPLNFKLSWLPFCQNNCKF